MGTDPLPTTASACSTVASSTVSNFDVAPPPSPASSYKDRIIFGPHHPPPPSLTGHHYYRRSPSPRGPAVPRPPVLLLLLLRRGGPDPTTPSLCNLIGRTNLHRLKTAGRHGASPAVLAAEATTQPATGHEAGHRVELDLLALALARDLLFFTSFCNCFYAAFPANFTSSNGPTHPIVDALYLCIVTLRTIGYGDITPASPAAKLFAISFVLIGFGFVDILLSGMVSYVLDL
ncbi:hypothetical protein ZWY2020_015320 [Hordeum vulgare]|nr:hypothetical protein ZWY2020_015320 [Hordeum vulgare]